MCHQERHTQCANVHCTDRKPCLKLSVVGKMKCVGLRVCGGYIYLGYFESWKSLLSPLLVCLLSLIFSDPSLAFYSSKTSNFSAIIELQPTIACTDVNVPVGTVVR